MSKYTPIRTHVVENQVPELGSLNWFDDDGVLSRLCSQHGAGVHHQRLSEFGSTMGTISNREAGRLANVYPPVLKTFDRFGHRIDEVEFHPAYHSLMKQAKQAGIHSLPWTADKGGHVAHTAMIYMLTQTEAGICCPLTMTYAGVPTLKHHSDWFTDWGPKVCAASYDGRHIPLPRKARLCSGWR